MLELRSARHLVAAGTLLFACSLGTPLVAQPESAPPSPATSPGPSPSPSPSASPQAHPQILSVAISPSSFHAGEAVTATVVASPDVVSVEGHCSHYHFNLPRQADGTFSGTSSIPRWTRIFFHGTFKVTFVAKDASGASSETWRDVTLL